MVLDDAFLQNREYSSILRSAFSGYVVSDTVHYPQDFNIRDARRILQSCLFFEDIVVESCSNLFPFSSVIPMLQPTLRSLDIDLSFFGSTILDIKFPRLTTVTMKVRGSNLFPFLSSHPGLRKLNLSRLQYYHSVDLSRIAKLCPNLEYLTLDRSFRSEEVITVLLSSWPKLKSLNHHTVITQEDIFQQIIRSHPDLSFLFLPQIFTALNLDLIPSLFHDIIERAVFSGNLEKQVLGVKCLQEALRNPFIGHHLVDHNFLLPGFLSTLFDFLMFPKSSPINLVLSLQSSTLGVLSTLATDFQVIDAFSADELSKLFQYFSASTSFEIRPAMNSLRIFAKLFSHDPIYLFIKSCDLVQVCFKKFRSAPKTFIKCCWEIGNIVADDSANMKLIVMSCLDELESTTDSQTSIYISDFLNYGRHLFQQDPSLYHRLQLLLHTSRCPHVLKAVLSTLQQLMTDSTEVPVDTTAILLALGPLAQLRDSPVENICSFIEFMVVNVSSHQVIIDSEILPLLMKLPKTNALVCGISKVVAVAQRFNYKDFLEYLVNLGIIEYFVSYPECLLKLNSPVLNACKALLNYDSRYMQRANDMKMSLRTRKRLTKYP